MERKIIIPGGIVSRSKVGEKIQVSEGVLLALLPMLAYVYTFVYNAGYCLALWIPINFISIGPLEIVKVGMVFFIFPMMIIMVCFTKIPEEIKFPLSIAKIMFIVALSYSIATLANLLSEGVFNIEDFFVNMCWLGISSSFVLEFIGNIIEKGSQYAPLDQRFIIIYRFSRWILPLYRASGSFSRLLMRISHGRYAAVICALFSFGVAYSVGKSEAVGRAEWLTFVEHNKTKVVLIKYGDDVIAADYDARTRMLSRSFSIYKIEKTLPENLVLRDIGFLRIIPHSGDDSRFKMWFDGEKKQIVGNVYCIPRNIVLWQHANAFDSACPESESHAFPH